MRHERVGVFRNQRSRRAFSLIELLILMSVSTLIVTVVSAYVIKLYRIDRQIQHDVDAAEGVRRFATQLREDVQFASAMEQIQPALTLADHSHAGESPDTDETIGARDESVDAPSGDATQLMIRLQTERINMEDDQHESVPMEITYARGKGLVLREVRRSDAVVHRDKYLIPTSSESFWEVMETDVDQRVTVTISAHDAGPVPTAHRYFTIQAIRGRNGARLSVNHAGGKIP